MATWKPGPGWRRDKSGMYHPHFFASTDFTGAQVVAAVFKVVAWLVLAAGAVATWRAAVTIHDDRLPIMLGIVGGTIISASTVAFFGYVLQLLVALHFDSHMPYAAEVAGRVERGEMTPPGLKRLG